MWKFFKCIFITASCAAAHAHSEKLMDDADCCFEAALFEKAIPLYQEIFAQDGERNDRQHACRQLTRAYFLSGEYEEAIKIGKECRDDQDSYIIGLAHSRLGQYDLAILTFEKFLRTPSQKLDYIEEIKFELAKAYFLSNQFSEAKSLFSNGFSSPQFKNLSIVYLSRIALHDGDSNAAECLLNNLEKQLKIDDPLNFEIAFWLGEISFQKNDFKQSVHLFEKALTTSTARENWHDDAFYRLGLSYFKLAEDPLIKTEEKTRCLDKAEAIFKKHAGCQPLGEISPLDSTNALELNDRDSGMDRFTIVQPREPSHGRSRKFQQEAGINERYAFALGNCYLLRSKQLKDEAAYHKAEQLFACSEIFSSHDSKSRALVLLAEAAPTYVQRDAIYRYMTHNLNSDSQLYAKGWFLRGLNDLEEGKESIQPEDESHRAFERAIPSLKKAFELLKDSDAALAALSLKSLAEAYFRLEAVEGYKHSLSTLDAIIQNESYLLSLSDPDEIYYIHATASSKLYEMTGDKNNLSAAIETLQHGLQLFPEKKLADAQLNLLGILFFKSKEFKKSQEKFLLIVEKFPQSPLAGESLFWAARCCDELQETDESRLLKSKVFESYPHSKYAAEAYFSYYTFRDYVQGDKSSIKHLNAMLDRFPDSPFLVHAYYLIGMDHKRDRRSNTGRWLRKKNFIAAIDAFQQAETTFDLLHQKGLLPIQDLESLTAIRYQAELERALTNLAIAEESQGAKSQIYLEYAEEVFRKILNDSRDAKNSLHPYIQNVVKKSSIEEECSYWLAQICIKLKKEDQGEQILNDMLEKFQHAKITRGYFLSRALYAKGLIALNRNESHFALECMQKAEEAAKGNLLSTQERLDLWIQQSICFQKMNDLENSILILSKVVNDDSISSLRVKAMYLRAEAYEIQGRKELAKRQLEATSKKGGEWSLKAKEKLKINYGY